jgi:hypothetical protein
MMQHDIIKNIFYYICDYNVRKEELKLTRMLFTCWDSDIDNVKEYK